MKQDFELPRERNTKARVNTAAIQAGLTVYDVLDRAVGNVTDVESEVMHVDGRPEGMGFLDVPLAGVREVEDGRVYLNLELEQIGRPAWADRTPAEPSSGYGDAEAAFQDTRPAAPVTWRVEPSPATHHLDPVEPGGEPIQGSSFTASGTPLGLGSNTPVGSEPSSYRAWDADLAAEPRPQYVLWSVGFGAGAAAAGLYAWWYQHQRRRSRLSRIKRAVGDVSGALLPLLEAAGERRVAWWLTSLAMVPLGLYLRSTREENALKQARANLPAAGKLTEQLRSVSASDLTERLQKAAESRPEIFDASPPWNLAAPALIAAIAATWFATKGRRPAAAGRHRGTGSRLGTIMTRSVEVARPDSTLFDAAATMRRLDVGALPVCDGRRLLGMLTDRDIVIRSVAESRDPHLAAVSEAMTAKVVYAFADDSVERAAELMRQHRIRRLPIVDREKQLVGIVSLGDLAVDTGNDRLSGATLERVSEPAQPRR